MKMRLPATHLRAQNRLRRKTDLASAFNPFGRVKKLLENILLFQK
jgi:hypothetical protein